MPFPHVRSVVLAYAIVATLWIFFSDALLAWLIDDEALLLTLSVGKGLVFVGVTALGLYALLRQAGELGRQNARARHATEFAAHVRDSEARLQRVIDGANDGWWEWDLQTDELVLSERWWSMLGHARPAGRAESRVWRELVHPDDRSWADALISDALEGQSGHYELECRMRHRDGHYVPVLSRAHIERDADGDAMLVSGANTDLTRRKEAEEAQRLADIVFRNASDGIMVTDADSRILDVNPTFEHLTGFSRAEVLGQNPRILHSGRQDAAVYRDMWASINATGQWRGEIWNRRRDGEIYPEWLTITAVRDEAGQVTHYIGMFSDLTGAKQTQAELEFLSNYDALTRLPNRVLLHERLGRAIGRARRTGSLLGVMYLDLDRFKIVNAGMGYPTGDEVLRQLGCRLGSVVRAEDTLARVGGDEFGLLIEDERSIADIETVARKLLEVCAEAVEIDGQSLTVTTSIGISVFPNDGDNPDILLGNADSAMNQAKKSGRNGYRFFSPELTAGLLQRVRLEAALRRAVEQRELCVHYQPQVALATGTLAGVEALVRWPHPEHGMVSPADFIPLAEEIGLIDEIGAQVLDEACRQQREWMDAGVGVPRVAVNLSAQQLAPGFVDEVRDTLARHALPPAALELELTESMLMQDQAACLATMLELQALGVRIAIDDFGTGYSSLAYLKKLPIDYLKIDRSFVRDIGADEGDEAIVRAIIALARSLGLRTVAEGVETAIQHDYLRAQGCDLVQGYFHARPLAPQELLRHPLLAESMTNGLRR